MKLKVILLLIVAQLGVLNAEEVYLGRCKIERGLPSSKHLYTYCDASSLDQKEIADNLIVVTEAVKIARAVLVKHGLNMEDYRFSKAEIKQRHIGKTSDKEFWVWKIYFYEMKGELMGKPNEIFVSILGSGKISSSKLVGPKKVEAKK